MSGFRKVWGFFEKNAKNAIFFLFFGLNDLFICILKGF